MVQTKETRIKDVVPYRIESTKAIETILKFLISYIVCKILESKLRLRGNLQAVRRKDSHATEMKFEETYHRRIFNSNCTVGCCNGFNFLLNADVKGVQKLEFSTVLLTSLLDCFTKFHLKTSSSFVNSIITFGIWLSNHEMTVKIVVDDSQNRRL